MSTYDDASLVMIPSGYKTGTVFSQKPMSTDGQLAFTRSNDTATRVASNGLIEKVRTNLVTYSQNFANAAWSKSAGTTLTHSQTDPDGGTTATRVVMTSGVNNFFTQAISGSGTRFITLSVWVKGVTTGGTLSLNTGTAASRTGTTITYTTTWTRYEIIQNETTSNTGFQIDNYSNSVGQVAGDFLIAFAQVESSDFGATPYIATTTAARSVGPVANVPRLDYLNTTCPRLLLEPQTTALMTFSEQLDNAAWDKTSGGAAITANSVTSPDGYTNADTITGTGAGVAFVLVRQTITVPSAATYTFSGFFKYNNHPFVSLNLAAYDGGGSAYYNIQTGVVGTVSAGTSATITNYGNGWYRCTLTAAIGASDLTGRPSVYVAYQDGTSDFPNTATATGKAAYAWGFNLTQSSYATSYIPTLAASVTRGADACSKTGISSLIGQTEGTLFVDLNYETISGLSMFLSIRPNATNKIEVYRDGQTIYGDILGNSVSVLLSKSANPAGRYKIALAYKSGQTSLYINGTSVGTSATAFSFATSMADLFINLRSGPTFVEQSFYNQVLLFKTRLPNSELASLTTL